MTRLSVIQFGCIPFTDISLFSKEFCFSRMNNQARDYNYEPWTVAQWIVLCPKALQKVCLWNKVLLNSVSLIPNVILPMNRLDISGAFIVSQMFNYFNIGQRYPIMESVFEIETDKNTNISFKVSQFSGKFLY